MHTYIPIGDSYTAGIGAKPEESFPTVLVRALQKAGIAVEMPKNPAIGGWTSQQAIDLELPVLRHYKASFSTLLIGGNDIIQSVPAEIFRKNFAHLLDELCQQCEQRVVVCTIPDWSQTEVGKEYHGSKITAWNEIIKEEANARNLLIADLFAHSHEAGGMKLSDDKLHPTAEEYASWVGHLLPLAIDLLQ